MVFDESSILNEIWDLLSEVWEYIKKVWYQIINFFSNIVAFFREKRRLEQLQKDKDKIAVAVKTRLENGDYNVVNVLFDTEEGTIVNPEEDALVMESGELDNETKKHFGNKDMIVLK